MKRKMHNYCSAEIIKKKTHTKTPSILKAHFCFLAPKVPAVMVYLIPSVF